MYFSAQTNIETNNQKPLWFGLKNDFSSTQVIKQLKKEPDFHIFHFTWTQILVWMELTAVPIKGFWFGFFMCSVGMFFNPRSVFRKQKII